MAINAPIITPDPAGNFLESFKTFDTSARDRERLAMEQDRLVQAKIQQMRMNKADDFKLMMDAINRQDKLEQQGISNEFKERELGLTAANNQAMRETAMYNARSQRYTAMNPNRRGTSSGAGVYDPLGLSGEGATPVAPTTPGTTDLTLPGDDVYQTPAASSLDIPQSLGGAPVTDDVDLPSRGGGSPQTTVLGIDPIPPEGEAGSLLLPQGGELPPAAPGDNTPTLSPAAPATSAPAPQQPVPDFFGPSQTLTDPAQLPAGYLGPPDIQNLPPSPPTPLSLPPPAPAQEGAPPTFDSSMVGPLPPSLSAAPIDYQTNNTLLALSKAQSKLKVQEDMAKANAAKTRVYLDQVAKLSPKLVPKYIEKLVSQQAEADNAADQAAETEAKLKVTEAHQKLISKRQQALRIIGGDLAKVLPSGDQQTLLKDASDPTNTAADDQIKELNTYLKVRKIHGMKAPSNGLETASAVARIGEALSTPEAIKDKLAFNRYTVLKEEIAKLRKIEEAGPLNAADQKMLDTLNTQQISELAPARMWEARQAAFDMAKEADTWTPGAPNTGYGSRPTPLRTSEPPPVAPPAAQATPMSFEQRKAQNANGAIEAQWTTLKTNTVKNAIAKLDEADRESALLSIQKGERDALAAELFDKGSDLVEMNRGGLFEQPKPVFKYIQKPGGGEIDAFEVMKLAANSGAPQAAPTDPVKKSAINAARAKAGLPLIP